MRLLRTIFTRLWAALRWVFSYSSEIEYDRKCRERPLLDDDAFVERFYNDSSIPKDIPIRVRKVYRDQLYMAKVYPEDIADDITPDLDLGELLIEIEEEFGIEILDNDTQPGDEPFDGSFDAIVRLVVHTLSATKDSTRGDVHSD
jgi:acyl carrier protein